MYQQIEFEIEGIAPLIMHNGQLADPFNQFARAMKEITDKKKRTDADLKELQRVEFMGGLYLNEDSRVIVPGENIEAMLVEAAKHEKLGKTFKAGILCDASELDYEGPRDVEGLWEAGRFRDYRQARIGRSRCMRCRPRFERWALRIIVHYLENVVNPEQIVRAMRTGGQLVGLLDFRPRFGRFQVASHAVK